jgi:hypothetical protein
MSAAAHQALIRMKEFAPLKAAMEPRQGPSIDASRVPESSILVNVGRDPGFTEAREAKG